MLPALLDKNFSKLEATSYPEEGVVVVKDDRGVDVLDSEFKYVDSLNGASEPVFDHE